MDAVELLNDLGEPYPSLKGVKVSHPEHVVREFTERFKDLKRECFYVLLMTCKLMTCKHEVIDSVLVSVGSLSATIIHPREVFKAAILQSASSIICVRNHPAGDPKPSPEDRAITRRLQEAGDLLGITLRDHIVIGAESKYSSFVTEGLL